MTFGLNVTTQNLHSVQLFANTKRVNFRVFFLIFEVGLRSNWPSKPMKMTFLLFCVVIFNDTRFFSTYFAVHCCLVWCVGVPQSFFTVHNECGSTFVEPLKSKKKYQTASEIPFECKDYRHSPLWLVDQISMITCLYDTSIYWNSIDGIHIT